MSAWTFQLVSFGCRVNQAEGGALGEALAAEGLREADGRAPADLVIVNTCAVTAEAARQSRQQIRRAARQGARVIVTGCGAHAAAGDDPAALPGVWFAAPDKAAVLDRIRAARPRGPAGTRPPAPRSRGLLKVQDGCTAACTYCLVRKVRSTLASAPPAEAARALADLVAAGMREVVVCGIHLGLYGEDLRPRVSLADLLARLLRTPGLGRLRLSSLEPMEVTGDLAALLAAEPERLCPHLHLPLQSGDDGVLARMGRPYRSADYLATLERVRAALDRPAITTDVLVGFPGETDAAFENTLRVCREAGFARMHVFPFSRRPGTEAAAMPGQVPREAGRRRRGRAAELGEALAAAFRAGLVGLRARVAIEMVGADRSAEGTCERFQRVRVRGPLPPGAGRREIVPVRLVAVHQGALLGEPLGG